MSVWTDSGENRVANILFGSTAVDTTIYMGVYTSPTTEPGETATISTLTEPSGSGYARIALTRGTWTVTGSNAAYAQQTFSASGGAWGNCYGYFIATSSAGTGGVMLMAEHFANGPYSIGDGDFIKVTPTISVA